MEENYEKVPNIISCKDLDYLSDMFNWNYGAYKSAIGGRDSVQDGDLKGVLEKVSGVFYSTMTQILDILNTGGNHE